jgi:mannose-6-phosphate isomerase-like protein (cupin superfamily)
MNQRAALGALLQTTRAWHAALSEAVSFSPWPDDAGWQARAPRALPASDLIRRNPGTPNARSTALLGDLQAAAAFAEWRQSYGAEDLGQHFLDHSGWFELAGPEGHFVTRKARITVGYWGPGLFYPRHQNASAELYTIVSGRATFHADGVADADLGPGQTRFHAPNQPHAMTTQDHPVLAVVFWRGERLEEAPRLAR